MAAIEATLPGSAPIELWWQDEARVGQKNGITSRWAKRDIRPSALMTPLAEIAQLKIGSRPASRTKSDRIEDLRAIPWVFSCAQARVMLPGWYGAADGLAEANDIPLLKEMYEGWRFLRPFPGLMAIASPISVIGEAPPGWVQRLADARGVYLLACPRTGELYVGSATGAGGFWSRWQEYRRTGHGGNIALIGREPTDWRVSVLQVAGSVDSADDILAMEAAWKVKLQAREFGLCRN